MTLGKPLRDEGSSGSDDERERKRRRQQVDAPSEDEQRAEAAQAAAEAAKAAEVRAARVVTVEAEVVARAAELALVTAKKDLRRGENVSSGELWALEDKVLQAHDDEKVAKARVSPQLCTRSCSNKHTENLLTILILFLRTCDGLLHF